MSPSDFDPQKLYTDTVNQAKSAGSSALLWGALLMFGVAWIVFKPGRR